MKIYIVIQGWGTSVETDMTCAFSSFGDAKRFCQECRADWTVIEEVILDEEVPDDTE